MSVSCQKETFGRVLAIADILAIIRHRESGRHSLLSPDRTAGASWGNGECPVPVFEITRYRCLGLDYGGIVAVVDNCASHPTEHRLDDVQKLRLRGQGQYLDMWCFVVLGPTIEKFDAVEELLGRMPRRRIPREVNPTICLVVASQLVD
jgi:hypothetical protein